MLRGQRNIGAAVIHTLATCDWVKKGLPLCLIGDSGTGKFHLLIALGAEAAISGFRVDLQRIVRRTRTFTDPRVCAAIVDRLTFGGNIIETGTVSYRLASTRAARAQDAAGGPHHCHADLCAA